MQLQKKKSVLRHRTYTLTDLENEEKRAVEDNKEIRSETWPGPVRRM